MHMNVYESMCEFVCECVNICVLVSVSECICVYMSLCECEFQELKLNPQGMVLMVGF